MYSLYPTGLDTWVNPGPFDTLDGTGVEHDIQHTKANQAISGLETKVGITDSTNPSSLDYRIRYLETGVTGVLKTTSYQRSGTSWTSTIIINMDGPPILNIALSGDTTFATTNRASAPNMSKIVTATLSGDSVNRGIDFAAEARVMGARPTGLLANKVAQVSFQSNGPNESNTVIGYASEA
jgi:hypothetical protein